MGKKVSKDMRLSYTYHSPQIDPYGRDRGNQLWTAPGQQNLVSKSKVRESVAAGAEIGQHYPEIYPSL